MKIACKAPSPKAEAFVSASIEQPYLKRLELGSFYQQWQWHAAMRVVHLFLDSCHSLQDVRIWLIGDPKEQAQELRTRFGVKGAKHWRLDHLQVVKSATEYHWLKIDYERDSR